ncbi:MAG: FmdB family zinc ribbon protein [Candidatus Bipolaricaulia bacterium]
MPLYRYKCDHCGYTFTVLEPANGNSLRVCSQCGRHAARRTISHVGIVYKGSGFHSTDYRRNGKWKDGGATEREKEEKEKVQES